MLPTGGLCRLCPRHHRRGGCAAALIYCSVRETLKEKPVTPPIRDRTVVGVLQSDVLRRALENHPSSSHDEAYAHVTEPGSAPNLLTRSCSKPDRRKITRVHMHQNLPPDSHLRRRQQRLDSILYTDTQNTQTETL